MRTLAVGQSIIKFNNFKSNDVQTKVTEIPINKEPKKPIISKDNAIPLVSAAVAVASLGVSAFAISRGKKNNGMKDEIVKEAKNFSENLVNDLKNKVEALQVSANNATTKIENLSTDISNNAKEIAEKAKWFDGVNEALENKINSIATKQNETFRPTEKNLAYVDGKSLLQNLSNDGKRIPLKNEVKAEIQAVAQKYMKGKDATGAVITAAALTAGSTIWLPTAESLPEKEGGLAEVPVQMAMNMDKIGVNNYIVRPLMEVPGKTEFVEKDGKYYYYYPGLDERVVNEEGKTVKKEAPIELEKVVEFETKVFRNGKYETQPVEVFYGEDTIRGYKRLMFRNKDYFSAPGLYKQTQMVSEAERYTFFNKAMYDFMKIKMDSRSLQGYKVPNAKLLDSIQTPDAIVLNDWHCGPSAALMRYKAPLEASAGELNKDAADKIKNMNLLYIVHNSDYQGDDWVHTSDILNTLFDQYALDVYENAVTGFTETYKEDGRIITQPINSLYSTMLIDGNINMANMGMCLANKVKPVSETYAFEMAKRPERARGLMHVTEFRLQNKTLEGASNGWDRVANEIAEDTKPYKDTVGMMNKDVSFIKDVVKRNPDFKYVIPAERNVKPVTSKMSIDEIMENRKYNKKQFVEFLKSSLDYNKAAAEYNSKLKDDSKKLPYINFDTNGVSDLSDIDTSKLDEIPVLTLGVRFVEQKGIDIVSRALKDLYQNWETYYPNKERPIIVIGGEDPIESPNGPYRNIAQNLKRELGEQGERLLYMDGFTPNPAFYAGSDFTLRPSHFEPDGDKWESLYRGTPMIMTKVGGHVDSITDSKNGFLSARTVSQICEKNEIGNIKNGADYNETYLNEMASDYEEAMRRGLDAFYNKKEYQKLVYNSIQGDQSWVQYDQEGKIKDCPLVGHMRDLGFDLQDDSFNGIFAQN